MRLPYQLHGGHSLPLCDVTILGTRFNAIVPAVIDSGAVRPIFRKSDARDAGLNVDLGKPEPIVFGGSTTIGRLLKTYVLIAGYRFELDIVYVDELKLDYALLGRTTFFNQFNEVAFHERTLDRHVRLRG